MPKSLKSDGQALLIEWQDGPTHRLPWGLLRERCPCATCRTDRQKPPTPPPMLQVLTPQEARPLKVVGMRPMGNYAYAIEFSDGHSSGIYSFEHLRKISPESTQ